MTKLEEFLRELARTDEQAAPSPAVEQALLSELRARRRPRRWLWPVAATLLLAAGGFWFAADGPNQPETATTPEAPLPTAEFYVLETGRPLSEMRSGRLMRVTLPASAPAYFGLPPLPPGAGIEADVLLSDDGVAQAVRFVY